MKLHAWFSCPTMVIALAVNWVLTAFAQDNSPPCNSLTESARLAAGRSPDVVGEPFGNTHVVWQDPNLGVMYEQIGADGGITVPPINIYSSKGFGFPRIAVDTSGDAHIATTAQGFGGVIY